MLEIFQDATGEYRYRVKGKNGEIIMTSEGYTTRTDAWRGFHALRVIVTDTNTPWTDTTHPEGPLRGWTGEQQ